MARLAMWLLACLLMLAVARMDETDAEVPAHERVLSAGAAWSAQYRGTEQVAVCFFGDGTTNIGAFHEALNFAGDEITASIRRIT